MQLPLSKNSGHAPSWSQGSCALLAPALPFSLTPSRTPSPVLSPGMLCAEPLCPQRDCACLYAALCVLCSGCIIRAAESKSHPSLPPQRRVSRSCAFPSCPSKRGGEDALCYLGEKHAVETLILVPPFGGAKASCLASMGKKEGNSFFGNS